ncbi:MAG: ABC transporter ATP-binding protein [Candidatus Dormibacteraeota bacterium]|uniref:ABC transporter ATP-binding protein n=1 Tax=Candidatus Aeolococcus gillhamiae TaxID=3127015 RepID=A0A934K373_9BACT|nr:ABC transporter ATP-binding protein [Candidatus Dormibacteraeota bacterium]
MSEPAVRVTNVSKHFRVPLDRSSTLKYRVTHLRSASRYRDLLAVNDVSFNVGAGEFLGITGPNGCGKSTLLKILSRIYSPDSGRVRLAGRVAPFLELGVGFNPELSARENIFLGGAVLGMTRKELATRVDSILEFAELEEFADQKVKNFSSGMAVRLAFTVAIQADADVLLMDEVLAVGDARFQEKCFDVFSDYKRHGRTIILVSHDLSALNLYCDRVLLLQKGHLVADGPAADVTAQYRRIVGAMSEADDHEHDPDDAMVAENRWGTREVEITAVRLLDDNGNQHTSFATGGGLTVAIDYAVHSDVDDFVVGLAFKRSDGINISGPNTRTADSHVRASGPGTRGTISYAIPHLGLLGAKYDITAAIYDGFLNHAYDHIEDVMSFRVVDEKGRLGMVDLDGTWEQTVDGQSRAYGRAG